MQPFGENAANIPAFLGKLWKMVNDPNTDNLICWSSLGNSFVIQNQAQFWYELLPLYYKHNNMSSFVRQLNMYGFHKLSIVENGTMDADKDEIQFYHKYFQKGHPELLRNIKRKVTTSKTDNSQSILRHDDITKVLTDVKQLRGKQSNVDSQLTAMKQENAVLWRELSLLRQKHIKQQQIVNKLIQFLVSLVQPSTNSRMGVGVKRRMPLMLPESPPKKTKSKKPTIHDCVDNGPTIHELDTEIEITPEELFDEDVEDQGVVLSPMTSASPLSIESNKAPSVSSNDESGDVMGDSFWDKPEFVDDVPSTTEYAEADGNELKTSDVTSQTSEKVFLNPTARDTLLSNLVNGSYNPDAVNVKNPKIKENSNASVGQSSNNQLSNADNMAVARRDVKVNNVEDLDLHLETTQSEIDQLKDILHGCNSFDASTLLGLFSDDAADYGLNHPDSNSVKSTNNTVGSAPGDPLVSGGTQANSDNSLIDFNELFDDSLDGTNNINELTDADLNYTINTPLVVKSEPIFPSFESDY